MLYCNGSIQKYYINIISDKNISFCPDNKWNKYITAVTRKKILLSELMHVNSKFGHKLLHQLTFLSNSLKTVHETGYTGDLCTLGTLPQCLANKFHIHTGCFTVNKVLANL